MGHNKYSDIQHARVQKFDEKKKIGENPSQRVSRYVLHTSKVQSMQDTIISSLWGYQEVEWSTKDSEGQCGGIFTMWKHGSIYQNLSSKGKDFLESMHHGKVLTVTF